MKDSQQESHTESQRLKILERLLSGKSLTTKQCRRYWGADRASARIEELRRMRFPIDTKFIKTQDNKVIAQYSI